MRYPAYVSEEAGSLVAIFPDCPGCAAQADPGEDLAREAADALEGWLEAALQYGDVPPRPSAPRRAPRGAALRWIEVPPRLQAKLALRWARAERRWTQAQLARAAGVTQQMIAKLEHPDYNPSIRVLEKVARALGAQLSITFEWPASREAGRAAQSR